MTATTTPGRRAGMLTWALRLAGAVLLAVMGWLHLDLWLDGYRNIDVIGPAFMLNAIAGLGLAVLLLVVPHRWLWAVAALGALTALGTLAGLLLSTTVGLFGFVETTAAPLWWESFWVELAAVVVLAVLAVATRPRHR
ncbi:hypothetical protein E9549_11750 [Blastococcus sp. MG754426]|uniref:hypothetical protein n=1 Tax=unclassified Blastococcus TaxID=2619396 RepID=UPI001EEFCC34|nr:MULTISPECIES: hypothetical protein [unclassified Blastococcus]MCF6508074.1 hypothetical protein [Blastococcus sp. MG754426]MCF6511598.1 hypothetical protein [Blastococcus sp. MG754427]MCF6733761.1 hypothetical protein [Blastococcus sp. KM273129]